MQAAFAPFAPLPCRHRPTFLRRTYPVASASRRPTGDTNRLPLWAVTVTNAVQRVLRPAALPPSPPPADSASCADRLHALADDVAAETDALRAALLAAETRAAAAEGSYTAAWDALDRARIGRNADVAAALGDARAANRRLLGAMLSAQVRAAKAERQAGRMAGSVSVAEMREVTAKNDAVQISVLAGLATTVVITFFLHAVSKGDVAEGLLNQFI